MNSVIVAWTMMMKMNVEFNISTDSREFLGSIMKFLPVLSSSPIESWKNENSQHFELCFRSLSTSSSAFAMDSNYWLMGGGGLFLGKSSENVLAKLLIKLSNPDENNSGKKLPRWSNQRMAPNYSFFSPPARHGNLDENRSACLEHHQHLMPAFKQLKLSPSIRHQRKLTEAKTVLNLWAFSFRFGIVLLFGTEWGKGGRKRCLCKEKKQREPEI